MYFSKQSSLLPMYHENHNNLQLTRRPLQWAKPKYVKDSLPLALILVNIILIRKCFSTLYFLWIKNYLKSVKQFIFPVNNNALNKLKSSELDYVLS